MSNIEQENQEQNTHQTQSVSEIFKRQQAIPGWDQDKLSATTALVLGAGGLGSCVSIQLVRLGIHKVILVDNDVVEKHNLNRQIMYSLKDVGKPKVEQAKENLEFHNVGGTIIEAHNIDAVKEWKQIVQFAEQSQLIFNLIDYGDYFDLAVCSLSRALHLPLFQGGTFCNSLSVDYFPADARPCLLCLTDGLKKDLIEKLAPGIITSYSSLEFMPKNNNPPGQSNIVICQMCANFINSFVLNELFPSNPKQSKRMLLYLDPVDIVSFNLEITPKCPYCREPFLEGTNSHVDTTNIVKTSVADLWNLLKSLSFDKLFPELITGVKNIEGQNAIDSQTEITFKDATKWTILLQEISSLRKEIVFDISSTNPIIYCTKIRHYLSIVDAKDAQELKLSWKTEYLDDVPKSTFSSAQKLIQNLLQNFENTFNVTINP